MSAKDVAIGFVCCGLLAGSIAVASPPISALTSLAAQRRLSYDNLALRMLAPITDGEVAHNTAAAVVGTTEIEAVTTDITAAQTAADMVQIYTITNHHATQNLCVDEVDFSDQGSTDCNTDCAAATITCDGTASTDGAYVLPGSQRSFVFDSDRCVCVVGEAAGTNFAADRVIR